LPRNATLQTKIGNKGGNKIGNKLEKSSGQFQLAFGTDEEQGEEFSNTYLTDLKEGNSTPFLN
jgi:hypothetical protein